MRACERLLVAALARRRDHGFRRLPCFVAPVPLASRQQADQLKDDARARRRGPVRSVAVASVSCQHDDRLGRLEVADLHQRLAAVGRSASRSDRVGGSSAMRPPQQVRGRRHVAARERAPAARDARRRAASAPSSWPWSSSGPSSDEVAVRLLEVVAEDLLELELALASRLTRSAQSTNRSCSVARARFSRPL